MSEQRGGEEEVVNAKAVPTYPGRKERGAQQGKAGNSGKQA